MLQVQERLHIWGIAFSYTRTKKKGNKTWKLDQEYEFEAFEDFNDEHDFDEDDGWNFHH